MKLKSMFSINNINNNLFCNATVCTAICHDAEKPAFLEELLRSRALDQSNMLQEHFGTMVVGPVVLANIQSILSLELN